MSPSSADVAIAVPLRRPPSQFSLVEQRVLGIDPGAHGALGLVSLGGGWRYVDTLDMPIQKRGKSVQNSVLDARAFARVIEEWRPSFAVIENAQPMPARRYAPSDERNAPCPACGRDKNAMDPRRAFTFGGLCDSVRSVLEAFGVDVFLVQPATWKKAAGLQRGERSRREVKAASLELARELWPDAPLELVRHEARAEALLIARFGLASQMRF